MSFLLSTLIDPLRREHDPQESYVESFTVDGTQYFFSLENKPVVSQTVAVFCKHGTYTSGVRQVIPTGLSTMAAGLHYQVDLTKGQVSLFSGVYPTGAVFKPWQDSEVTMEYDASQYSDNVLIGYLTDAVPTMETKINLGYYVTSPSVSDGTLNYYGVGGLQPNMIGVMPEPLNIIQRLIVLEAALGLDKRERRLMIRGGGGISIADGDIDMNLSNVYRQSESLKKDLTDELKSMYADIKYNMDQGVSIIQMNESFLRGGGYNNLIQYDDDNNFRQYENYLNPYA